MSEALRTFIALVVLHLFLTACGFLKRCVARYKRTNRATRTINSDLSIFQIVTAFISTGLFIFYTATLDVFEGVSMELGWSPSFFPGYKESQTLPLYIIQPPRKS